MLWAETHSSLAAWIISELKVSPTDAYRKIDGMRLLGSLPEIEPLMRGGEFSPTKASQVQAFLRKQEYSKEESLSLIQSVLGQSTREVERHLVTLDPTHVPHSKKDKERA